MPERARLAVLGSPIAHSKSPALHSAAYRVLGLDWSYEAREVRGGELDAFLDSLTPEWRGLSLTMPLKRDVVPLLHEADEIVGLTGVANTVVREGGRLRGANTDVHGIERAFAEAGVRRLGHVLVLGGGATAASAIVAAHRMGASDVAVALRDPGKAGPLIALADQLHLELAVGGLDPLPLQLGGSGGTVISTLPNAADVAVDPAGAAGSGTVFFDVAYEPWPTPLARRFLAAGSVVIPGIEMLLHQAVAQIRLFTSGSGDQPLPEEGRVIAAMRSAVGI